MRALYGTGELELLADFHEAGDIEALCRLLFEALARHGFNDRWTFLQRNEPAGMFSIVQSTEILPDTWPSFSVSGEDPLLSGVGPGHDLLVPPGLPPREIRWNDLATPVFGVAAMRSSTSGTGGYLLLHGSHAAPVEKWAVVRPIITHFELALDRLLQMAECRRQSWTSEEALSAMNEMGALMGTLDLQILLTKILELALRLSGAEVGSIVLRQGSQLESRVEWGLSREAAESIHLTDGRTLLAAAIESGVPEYVPNVYLDTRLDTGVGSVFLDSIVILPLTTTKGTLGAINIVNVSEERGFTQDRLSTLKTISSLAAIAVENARYHQDALESEKLKEQARIAETIQKGFFPRLVPLIPGLEIAGKTDPAQFVGGDYYDFVDLGNGRLGVAVADVSGHGISSGLVMTMTRTLFRAAAQVEASPGRVLRTLNAHLCAEDLNGAFVTFMYAIIDAGRREVCLASAGHTPVVHHCRSRAGFEAVGPEGLPLGLFEAEYPNVTFNVGPGDSLLFLTDGLVEAMNLKHQPFGMDGVQAVLERHGHLPAPEVLDHLHREVMAHTRPGTPHDDVTTVLIRLA